MTVLTARRGTAAALIVAGAASGCTASAAQSSSAPAQTAQTAQPSAVSTTATTAATVPAATLARARPTRRRTQIDRLTAIARRRYAIEVHGGVAVGTLHRVGRDPVFLRTLRSGNLAATRAYVGRQFSNVWYHWHVSRMRVLQGSRVVIDAGVPFVVAPSRMTLRDHGGRPLGTLEVSIQDEIGFVRYLHRNYPVDVVVRGQGPGHVKTSLPAAATRQLPSAGAVTIARRRYVVRQFRALALGGEPVTVSILARG